MKNFGISIYDNSAFNTDKIKRESISPEEALKVFDFKVVKEQDFRPNGTPITDHYHLVRKFDENDEGVVIGTGVGKEFNVDSQPIDALRFMINEILPEVPGLKIETVAATRDGATTFANFQFGTPWKLQNDTSEHTTRLMYVNPLCQGSIKILSHELRIACMNTLNRAEKIGTGFKIPHTINSKFYVQAALEAIHKEIKAAKELEDKIIVLDNIKISSKNIEDILNGVYPIKKDKNDEDCTRTVNMRNAVMEQFESDKTFLDKTGWSFLNAMTYNVQHPKMTGKRDANKVEIDNIIGPRATLKAKMLDETLKVLCIA